MVAGGITFYESYIDDLVGPETLAINEPSIGAKIYDRNGHLLYEYLDETAGQRFPISVDEVSDAFIAATISTEDDTFFVNPGVNTRGLARAAWENLTPLVEPNNQEQVEGSGGSSITQQLAKNVYIPWEERAQRSIDRKVREAAYAVELTKRYGQAPDPRVVRQRDQLRQLLQRRRGGGPGLLRQAR